MTLLANVPSMTLLANVPSMTLLANVAPMNLLVAVASMFIICFLKQRKPTIKENRFLETRKVFFLFYQEEEEEQSVSQLCQYIISLVLLSAQLTTSMSTLSPFSLRRKSVKIDTKTQLDFLCTLPKTISV